MRGSGFSMPTTPLSMTKSKACEMPRSANSDSSMPSELLTTAMGTPAPRARSSAGASPSGTSDHRLRAQWWLQSASSICGTRSRGRPANERLVPTIAAQLRAAAMFASPACVQPESTSAPCSCAYFASPSPRTSASAVVAKPSAAQSDATRAWSRKMTVLPASRQSSSTSRTRLESSDAEDAGAVTR